MTEKLLENKIEYYNIIDTLAKNIARDFSENRDITQKILKSIWGLYSSVGSEKRFSDDHFKCAYHNPVTSELEFFISRILYHYSDINSLGWNILLRKQSKGKDGKLHVPDILIKKNDKSLAIVEIKAKAGWIQPFFSSERVQKDLKRKHEGKSDYDPIEKIGQIRKGLEAYAYNFDLPYQKVYLLLPTLAMVHRKKSKRTIEDYKADFAKNSGLNKDNLILLSDNLNLNLDSRDLKDSELSPTKDFEDFINEIQK